MPPKRNPRRRKNPPKRAKGANDKTVTVWSNHSVLEKANKALNMASQIYRFINVEIKAHYVVNTVLPDYNGTIVNLTQVAQGDTNSTRDGASIKPMVLTLRGHCLSNTTTNNTQLRVIIFRGKQENGVSYTPTDLLQSIGSSVSVNSSKNYSERFRTKILMDRVVTLNNNISGTQVTKRLEKTIKLLGHVTYDDSDTTGATIENGGIYMLCISDQATNTPAYSFFSRLTYTDN